MGLIKYLTSVRENGGRKNVRTRLREAENAIPSYY
jgi:hypothetical protein